MSEDIVERLRRWAEIPLLGAVPEELGGPNNWHAARTKLDNEAADEIEKLRRYCDVLIEKLFGQS